MAKADENSYLFHCKIIEIVNTGEERNVFAVCDPGSFILKVPDDGNYQLGDKVKVTGTIKISASEMEATWNSTTKPK